MMTPDIERAALALYDAPNCARTNAFREEASMAMRIRLRIEKDQP